MARGHSHPPYIMWTVRSIQDDIIIEQRRGYCTAEYEPLQLVSEGSNEREARDALMLDIWANVARMYEGQVRERAKWNPTIKEMMDEVISQYWETHTPKTRYKDEKVGVVVIEVDAPDPVAEVYLLSEGRPGNVVPDAFREETQQDMEKE